MPVVVLRLLNGRVGSTLVMQLLATSPRVVFDRVYPFGEYRYLSYCMRMSSVIAREHDPAVDRVTPFFFTSDAAGPMPWEPELFDRRRVGPLALRGLWGVIVTRFLGHGVMADRGLRGLGATCQRTQLG